MGARRRPRVPARLVPRSSDGEPVYHAIWAHDRAGEKAAFEAFVDLVIERHGRDPGMHVYHYGGYETGALKRLMQRHATREDEVDRLLRGGRLRRPLHHVVRQGIRASVESYSIKKIEKFYMPEREGRITDAGFSVVAYERWMETRRPAILDEIAAYNRDDCVSTWMLRDWLEARRDRGRAARPRRRRAAAASRSTRSRPSESWRRPRPRPAPARTRSARRPGRPRGARRRAAGPLAARRHSSTGIAARRSPSGGTTTGCSTRSIGRPRRGRHALGGLEFVEDLGPIKKSRAPPLPVHPRRSTSSHVGRQRRSIRRPAKAPARSSRSIRSRGHARPQTRTRPSAASAGAHPRRAVPDRSRCATRSAGSPTT